MNLYFEFFIGCALTLFFITLFIYFSIRDINFLYYSFYILLIALFYSNFMGYLEEYFSPNLKKHSIYINLLINTLVGISTIFFIKISFNTKNITPKLDKGLSGFIVLYILAILLVFINQQLFFKIPNILNLIVYGYLLYSLTIILTKRYIKSDLPLFGWIIFLIGQIISTLSVLMIIPSNITVFNTELLITATALIILFISLSDRINFFRHETVEILKENETLVKEQNILLEKKVIERTVELNKTLNNLKATQSQLVDFEKMSSLGRLTAGLAHEINNPLNFINSGVISIKRELDELLSNNNKEINTDEAKSRIDETFESVETGIERINEIITSFLNTSRIDDSKATLVDLHEIIDETLKLFRLSFKDDVKIIKQYKDVLNISCYPTQLRQALINIFTNSYDAIRENNIGKEGQITINTSISDDLVQIFISDNGIGVDQETKSRMFEPFFTTKEIGKGVGLGLSIVYNQVKHHNGDIQVNSERGKGTEIIISLPNNV